MFGFGFGVKCQFRIRVPSGKAWVADSVPKTCTLEQALLYAETMGQDEEEIDSVLPPDFEFYAITTSYPRKVFTHEEWATTTVEAAGIFSFFGFFLFSSFYSSFSFFLFLLIFFRNMSSRFSSIRRTFFWRNWKNKESHSSTW